ncbi:hypothetical protein D3C81_1260500 [compost metagenome]
MRKGFEQQRNVFAALAQWRQAQFGDVQAIGEVFAETPGARLFQQVRLGRGDHPQVDGDALVGAEPLQRLFLQHAQQLDLLRQRHALDLVEEQGAAVGMFQLADALALGAGERAALMTEQLAFEQLLGDRRAVEGDEGLAGPWPEVVQAARDQFLAAAGFAADQHVDRRRRQIQHLPAQGLQGRGDAEQARLDVLAQVGLLAQLAVLQHQLALVHGAAQALQQGLRAERLFQEVVGALVHGLHRHRHVAMAGQEDHRQLAVQLLRPLQQAETIQAGHAHVAQDHAGKVAAELLQAILGAGERLHLEAGQFQPLLHRFADARLVVDDHHRIHSLSSPRSAGRRRLKQAPPSRLPASRLPPVSMTMP